MGQSAFGGIPLASLARLATRELPHLVSGLAVEAAWATTRNGRIAFTIAEALRQLDHGGAASRLNA